MKIITTNPKDPNLHKVGDDGMNEAYLVLSEEERAKGFVRPYRDRYIHKGIRPKYSLRDLTKKEHKLYDSVGYVKYEKYPKGLSTIGKFWTKEKLESGCGTETIMGRELSETYARNPKFYGATYCVSCRTHFPVSEFNWSDGKVVGS